MKLPKSQVEVMQLGKETEIQSDNIVIPSTEDIGAYLCSAVESTIGGQRCPVCWSEVSDGIH